MKFVIDIPDEDILASSAAIGLQFGPDTEPIFDEATAAIQDYFDTPYNKVKRLKVKKEDPEVLAKALEVDQKKKEYADLVAQKSGTPKEDSLFTSESIKI